MKKVVLIVWIICGVINWGATLADYMPRGFKYYNSRNYYGISAGMALGGCITFPLVLLHTNFYQHGFDWK